MNVRQLKRYHKKLYKAMKRGKRDGILMMDGHSDFIYSFNIGTIKEYECSLNHKIGLYKIIGCIEESDGWGAKEVTYCLIGYKGEKLFKDMSLSEFLESNLTSATYTYTKR